MTRLAGIAIALSTGAGILVALTGCTTTESTKDAVATGPSCSVDPPLASAATTDPTLLSEVTASVAIEGLDRATTVAFGEDSRGQTQLWVGGSDGPGSFSIVTVDPQTLTTQATVEAIGQPAFLQVTSRTDTTLLTYLEFTGRRPVQMDAATGATVIGPAFTESAIGLTVSPDGTRAYLPLASDGAIAVVDLASGDLACQIPLVGGARGQVALADDGIRAFIGFEANGGSSYRSGIEVLDRGTGATLAIFDAPALADLDLSPDQSLLAGATFSGVVLVDAATGDQRARADLDTAVDGVSWDPSGTYLYAHSYLDSIAWVIEPGTGAVLETLRLPLQPSDLVVTPGRGYVAGEGIALLGR